MEVFSRAYRAQFNKMTDEEVTKMSETYQSTFGDYPDDIIVEAAAVAVRRNDFLPSLQEFDECVRRAKLILESRQYNAQKRVERELEIRMDDALDRALKWEQILLAVGLTPDDAHQTAFYGMEPNRIGGAI